MAKQLTSTVHVHNPDTGETRVFNAGQTPPKEWAELITNPKAFAEQDAPVEAAVPGPGQTQEPPAPAPAKKSPAKKSTAKRAGTRKATSRKSSARSAKAGASS